MTDKGKRNLSPSGAVDELISKRARVEQGGEEPNGRALVPAGAPQQSKKQHARNVGSVPRTSSLAAPTMRLTGHVGEVFAAAFSSGFDDNDVLLASAGHDRQVLLWRVSGECDNVAALHGHKNAVLSLSWLGGSGGYGANSDTVLLSCSADGTARAWSVERGAQIKKAAEHGRSVVNCVAAATGAGAPPVFVTAGDDGVARVWDMRVRRSVAKLGEIEEEEEEEEDVEEEDEDDDADDDEGQQRRRQRRRRQQQRRRRRQTVGGFPLLACAINPAADVAYTAGVDNVVRAW